MCSPYALCNFFSCITFEAFSLDYFEEELLLCSRKDALDRLVIFCRLCCLCCFEDIFWRRLCVWKC